MRETGINTRNVRPGFVFVIEPDGNVLDALKKLLRGFGWKVESSAGIDGLILVLEQAEVTAVISEANVPGCAAKDVLHCCAPYQVPVIYMGHDVSPQGAVDLIQQGALDFLEKPFANNRLLNLLNQLRNRHNKSVRVRNEFK